jgi:site-specific recombinase XerD
MRYPGKSKARSLRAYSIRWQSLTYFFRERKITSPALLERQHCFDYVDWRMAQVKRGSGRSPGQNTAVGELRFLGMLLDEAVLRGYALTNHARKLQLPREDSDPKPEFSDENIQTIYKALRSQPVWMLRSFHIALHTGVRFQETRFERSQIDMTRREIVIEKPKGGKKRMFAIPIYASIADMVEKFMEGKESTLWKAGPEENPNLSGLTWHRFFQTLKGLPPKACFHSTRVTFISRGARAGVPQSSMMRLVNHASAEVHRIYQRLSPADALVQQSLIPIPLPDDAI